MDLKLNKLFSLTLTALLLTSCGSMNNFIDFQQENPNITALSTDNLNSVQAILEDTKKKAANNFNLPEGLKEASTLESFIVASNRLIFEEYDTNHNGMVDLAELREAPTSFRQLDRNNDKRLSFTEVMISQDRIKQQVKWIDTFYKDLFNAIDTNRDANISHAELNLNTELKAFSEVPYWSTYTNALSRNSSNKINVNQFSTLMNNTFINLQRKSLTVKVPPFNRSGKLPILLVQGYAEPSWFFMYGIYKNLRSSGWETVYPINLFPNITDIKEQARIIASKVEQIKKEQNTTRIDYVAHSMGGLIGRYYIQELNGAKNIDHYVSIATPHYGTNMAWFGIGEAAKQMRPGSDFLKKLNSGETIKPGIKYTSMWTKTDEIVVPAENALLQGSRIMPDIKYTGHLLVMWTEETYTQIKESLMN